MEFIHGDSETICLVVVFHVEERVVVDVAVEVHVWSALPSVRSRSGKAWVTHSTRQYHLYFCKIGCL